jgi:hypothetical protein
VCQNVVMAMNLLALVDDAVFDAMVAKEEVVSEDGIGAELVPTLIAWGADGALLGTASLDDRLDSLPQHQTVLLAGVRVMREGWGASVVALLAEAYTSTRSTDDGRSLAERFVSDPSVQECLTLVLVNELGEAALSVLPFKVGLGRTVEWGEEQRRLFEAPDMPNASLLYTALVMTPAAPSKVERTPMMALETLGLLGFGTVVWCGPSGMPPGVGIV